MITSKVGLKMVSYAKISPKVVYPGGIAGNAEEEDTPFSDLDRGSQGQAQSKTSCLHFHAHFSTHESEI